MLYFGFELYHTTYSFGKQKKSTSQNSYYFLFGTLTLSPNSGDSPVSVLTHARTLPMPLFRRYFLISGLPTYTTSTLKNRNSISTL